MAITPNNYLYDNLLTKFQSLLRTEYAGSIPVYIGEEYKKQRNSHIRIFPRVLQNFDSKEKSIVMLANVDFTLYLNVKGSDVQVKKHLFDVTNRLEQVLFNNKRDEDNAYFDGVIEDVSSDIKLDTEVFVDNLRVSRINYSVKIPLTYQVYGFFIESNGGRFLTNSNDNFLVLN